MFGHEIEKNLDDAAEKEVVWVVEGFEVDFWEEEVERWRGWGGEGKN